MIFKQYIFIRQLPAVTTITLLALSTAVTLRADPAVEIEKFRQDLLKIDKPEVKDIDLTKAPDFKEIEDIEDKLYKELTFLSKGEEANVYLAESAVDRPDIDIKKGDKIAVRAANIYNGSLALSAKWTLRNFIRSEKLRRDGITEFFPRFYGDFQASKRGLNYQEMELIDNTLDKQFNCDDSYNKEKEVAIIPDCVVLEFCLGGWAGAYFADIGSHDGKAANYGVKKVDYSRSYVIQNQEYIFPKTELSPKRIDIGGAKNAGNDEENVQLLKSYDCALGNITFRYLKNHCQITKNAEDFLNNLSMKNQKRSVFDVFADFYGKAKCGENGKDKINRSFKWPNIDMEKN